MKPRRPDVERINVTSVFVGSDRRALKEEAVEMLVVSLAKFGLQNPITLRMVDSVDFPGEGEVFNVPVLIAGAHRLEAARRLGWEEIHCVFINADERDARLWEIAENLHRADLSVQERADQIAEWVRLTEEADEEKSAQIAPKSKSEVNPKGSGRKESGINAASREPGAQLNGEGMVSGQSAQKPAGRPEGGVSAASRDLGIERTEVRRAIKIASIVPEAKAAAQEVGVTTQTALLEVAKVDAAQQVAKVHELAERRSKPAPAIKTAFESEEDWRRSLFTVWNRGAQDWRERAIATLDIPVLQGQAD